MGWRLSGVTRTGDRFIGVNFSEFLSQEKERRISFETNLVLSQRVRDIRVLLYK